MGVDRLEAEFAEFADEDEAPELQLREFKQGGDELVKQTIAMHLQDGVVGRIRLKFLVQYDALAATIYKHAEIPIKSSPLSGVGGGGPVFFNSSIQALRQLKQL